MINNSVGDLQHELQDDNIKLNKKQAELKQILDDNTKLDNEVKEFTRKIEENKRKISENDRKKVSVQSEIRLLEREQVEKHHTLEEVTRKNAEELRKSGMKLK